MTKGFQRHSMAQSIATLTQKQDRTFNHNLIDMLNVELGAIRNTTIDGVVYYLAHDVCRFLKLTNTTNVIRGLSGRTLYSGDRITKMKKLIEPINKYRPVHLITIEAVFQIILNGKSEICADIKEYLAMSILPRCAETLGV